MDGWVDGWRENAMEFYDHDGDVVVDDDDDDDDDDDGDK